MEITADFIWKMMLSAGLGAILGIERDKHSQDAGIRTILVTVLSTIALILLAPSSERIIGTYMEHFEAQKSFEKSKHQSDKAKQKRL